jgi:Fe2+ or Zn2+ uptake regulation protein
LSQLLFFIPCAKIRKKEGKDMAGPLKNTRQREAILQALGKARAPLSAEELCGLVARDFPKIALSTVYRNLERFARDGLLEKSLFHDGVTRYSPAGEDHGHYLICTACDEKIRVDGCPLEGIDKKLEQDTGYAISGHDLTIYGLCPKCKKGHGENL